MSKSRQGLGLREDDAQQSRMYALWMWAKPCRISPTSQAQRSRTGGKLHLRPGQSLGNILTMRLELTGHLCLPLYRTAGPEQNTARSSVLVTRAKFTSSSTTFPSPKSHTPPLPHRPRTDLGGRRFLFAKSPLLFDRGELGFLKEGCFQLDGPTFPPGRLCDRAL